MSKDAKITAEQLEQAVRGGFGELLDAVSRAVNGAPDGAVIAGSEEQVRDATAGFRRLLYERAIQLRTDAAKAAFSPQQSERAKGWRNKGPQSVGHLTANGWIRIERTVYWRRGEGTSAASDDWLGISGRNVSLAARELCCRASISAGGFRKSAENLERLGQIRVSADWLRRVVEQESRRALAARDRGEIGPDWQASDCREGHESPSRVMVGVDGVMVPVVTESEKRKRRQNRGRGGGKVGQRSGRRSRRRRRCVGQAKRYRGADNSYKEFKLVTFYDQAKEHQYAAGTLGNHEALGRLMRREASKLGLDGADEKASVSDGAKWIRRQVQTRLPMLDAMILDYYHLSEHVAAAANTCFGQGNEQAKQWRGEGLTAVWEEGPAAMLVRIEQTRKSMRASGKREALRKLQQYVAERAEMLDYPTFRERGYDVGSGPTEALCKTLTARLKGSGMRWDSPNAEGMMALAALDQSNLWKRYWQLHHRQAA